MTDSPMSSLLLRGVELFNIRSHRHVLFRPAQEGITALCGANGAGKSTIVDAVAWALYGTKPHGVPKTLAVVRDGATPGDDVCGVWVELQVGPSVLVVSRKITSKRGGVSCDVWEATLDASPDGGGAVAGDPDHMTQAGFTHVAGSAVQDVERFLRSRLLMDESGFLAAVFVQQKQVDALITATPRERAEVIEALTGISAVSAAVEKSRREGNDMRRAAATVEAPPPGAVEQVSASRDAATAEVGRLTSRAQTATARAQETALRARQARTVAQEAAGRATQAEGLSGRLSRADATVDMMRRELDTLVKRKEEQRRLLDVTPGPTPAEMEGLLAEAQARVQQAQTRHDTDVRMRDAARVDYTEASNCIAASGVDVEGVDLAAMEAEAQKVVDDMSAVCTKAGRDMSAASAQARRMDHAIDVLTGGDGTCPTCLQHVSDTSEAVASLAAQRDELMGAARAAEQAGKDAESQMAEASRRVATVRDVSAAVRRKDDALRRGTGLSVDVKAAESECTVARRDLSDVQEAYAQASRKADIRRSYDDMLARAQDIQILMRGALDEKASLSAELSALDAPSGDRVASLYAQAESAQDVASRAAVSAQEMSGRVALAVQQQAQAEGELERIAADVARYEKVQEAVRLADQVTRVVEEFRVDRVEHSVPVLSAYASDLMSRFTQGKFTSVALDGKFTASVGTEAGVSRPVGMLSGGELSAAAMALRLAISMLLTGGMSRRFIILDEVLVSMDTARAEAVLATLREVCPGQIILISHSDVTDAVADRVVSLP